MVCVHNLFLMLHEEIFGVPWIFTFLTSMHYKLKYLVETTKIGFGSKLTQINIFLGKKHFSSNWPKLVFCWNFWKIIGRSATIETFKAMSKITPPKCSVAGPLSSEQCLIFPYSAIDGELRGVCLHPPTTVRNLCF